MTTGFIGGHKMGRKSVDAAFLIEELLEYAKLHLSMREEDRPFIRNSLLACLKIDLPSEKQPSTVALEKMITPDRILNDLVSYAIGEGITDEEQRQLFDTYIMGLVTPAPSAVVDKFDRIKVAESPEKACDFLYDLSIKNNYIRFTDIQKNILWKAPTRKAELEITINLSKPEKDNKEVERLKNLPQVGYPKCLLCRENEGYYGRLNHPARQNLRTIPVTLDGKPWHMQFSPYVYYEQHCIVFSDEHSPMVLDHSTYRKLMDFVDAFPNYFIGSNACLPIVGGSILAHEHYQGGKHLMPLHMSKKLTSYASEKYPDVEFSTLDWYNTVVHLESANKESLFEAACSIHDVWWSYTDESVDIVAKTKQQHNAITPIVRFSDGKYVLDMILRNNLTSEEFPEGIFHAHPEHHNIKKESIGLIEAMGLFILPARLQRELAGVTEYITGRKKFTPKVTQDENHPLRHHFGMIRSIIKKYSNELSEDDAQIVIREYINETCEKILQNTAVFKDNDQGIEAFDKFLAKCDLIKK